MDEAWNLARFNQLPGIVSALDIFSESSTAYIVMEYLDGIYFVVFAVSLIYVSLVSKTKVGLF